MSVVLNPDDCLPLGVHEGYRQQCRELVAGGRGVEKLDSEAMSRFPTLEVLWLNDNKLCKLKGLEHNFRLKNLYLHNNRIASLVNKSCCIGSLAHLELLQLQNNLLQDLQATLKVLEKLTDLRQLNMMGNPLCNEQDYRARVIYTLPELELLDNKEVTPLEREAAVKLFAAPKIEKKMAFGSVLKPWDKLVPNGRYDESLCEKELHDAVDATIVRRAGQQRRAEAKAMREAARPRFEVASKSAGSQAFEFIARGRVPLLTVRLGELRVAPAAAAVAASSAAGVVSGLEPGEAKVFVKVNAMRVLPEPRRTRSVDVRTAVGDREPPDFRFDEDLLAGYEAAAYERGLQLLATGPEEAMSLALQLCEEASGKVLGTARVPIGELMRDKRTERSEAFEATFARSGGGVVAQLVVEVSTGWNLSNSGSDYLAHHRTEARADRRASDGLEGAVRQQQTDEVMGKLTSAPLSRLELAWQRVAAERGAASSSNSSSGGGGGGGGASSSAAAAGGRGGPRLDAAALLRVMKLLGVAATPSDVSELLSTVAQPKRAAAPAPAPEGIAALVGAGGDEAPAAAPAPAEPPTASLSQFRRAVNAWEARHTAAAREALERGDTAGAHASSQAALRIPTALLAPAEPPSAAAASRRATLTPAGRFAKDSFTIFRFERPAPGTAPDLSSSAAKPGSVAEASNALVFDKPGYDAFLKKKALLAPARGRQLLMTI